MKSWRWSLARAFCRHGAASENRTRLSITYVDEAGRSTRTLHPLGVWFWGRVWTAVRWCELRKDFRMLRLDRIVTMEDGGTFRPVTGQTLRDFMQTKAYLR